jgi:CRP/FNR family transcriptional regulator, cyclic AMP receptor protein
MISPATSAIASSAACIATTTSWWAVLRRICATSEQARPNARQLNAVEATSWVPRTSPARHRDAQRALIESGIFGKTDPDVVSALIEPVRPVDFPTRHVVFSQGDSGGCLYLIAWGKVKLACRRTDYREVVLNIVGASDVFGEVTAFDYGTREYTATTLTDVCAVAIERDQLFAWMAECPEIMRQIMRLLARRADGMTTGQVDFVLAEPAYRIANRLLLLGKRFGKRDGDVVRVIHGLTPTEIALFAGVAEEALDATLREFCDRGWIRFESGRLDIIDGRGLAALPARSSEVRCG